jgi:thioesterase domain-containing protein
MDELVDAYLAAIDRVSPHGPYSFLGYSLGGTIAYAAACRLRTSIGISPLVVLLDTPTTTGYDDVEPYRAVGGYALNLDLDYADLLRQGRRRAMSVIYEEALRLGVISAAFPLERLLSIFDTAFANMAAAHRYILPRFDGELVTIESGGGHEKSHWESYAPRAVRLPLPLPHAVMLEEKSARRVALAIKPYLSERREEAR